jgi:hypothetical protein
MRSGELCNRWRIKKQDENIRPGSASTVSGGGFALLFLLGRFLTFQISGGPDLEADADAVLLRRSREQRADGAGRHAVFAEDVFYVFWGELDSERQNAIGIVANGDGSLLRVVNQIGHHIGQEFAKSFGGVHDKQLKCFRQPEQQRKQEMSFNQLLGGSDLGDLFDEAANGLSRLGTLGDPGVHLVEVDVDVAVFFLGIVSAQDFEEAAIALETLVSGDDTIEQTAFGAFLTETDCYCHEIKYISDFRGGGGCWINRGNQGLFSRF